MKTRILDFCVTVLFYHPPLSERDTKWMSPTNYLLKATWFKMAITANLPKSTKMTLNGFVLQIQMVHLSPTCVTDGNNPSFP